MRAWLPVRAKLLARMDLKTDILLSSVSGNRSVERLDVRSIHRSVKQVATAKRLPPYHPHTLRHCCATHMHDHGAPIQAIAALLGHARLSTAQLYTRVSVGRMMETYRKAHRTPDRKQAQKGRSGSLVSTLTAVIPVTDNPPVFGAIFFARRAH